MSDNRESAPARRESGFTLVEVIVVLAVVLLLTGIAVPMVSGYLDDGRRAKAEAEVKMLASAMTSFFKDVGIMPTRNGTGQNNRLYSMLTGNAPPTTNPFSSNHTFIQWGMNASVGDVLDNHLLNNTPGSQTSAAYPTTGSNRWRGPYLAGSAPLDPWGRPYIVNVIASYYNHATNYKRVFVMSAGANGIIDTTYTATKTTNLAGDDLGIILIERN